MDYQNILQLAEEASKSVHDPELRKIAFQEIVRSQLNQNPDGHSARAKNGHDLPLGPQERTTRTKPRGKAHRAAGARDLVQSLEISTDEQLLPAWSSLSNDWKKFLWMLEAARAKGIDGLTSPEISYLIDRTFRENYKPALINNLKKKMKNGFVKGIKIDFGGRTADGWKILSGGISALNDSGVPGPQ